MARRPRQPDFDLDDLDLRRSGGHGDRDREARRALARAEAIDVGVPAASGRTGTSRAELLAALRLERVIGRERPLCLDQTCARVDLVTKKLIHRGGPSAADRYRLVEIKHGAGARFTVNQQTVYPMLPTRAVHFPAGLRAGGSPQTLTANAVDIQHFGTQRLLTIP